MSFLKVVLDKIQESKHNHIKNDMALFYWREVNFFT